MIKLMLAFLLGSASLPLGAQQTASLAAARGECRELFLSKKSGDEVDCFVNHVRVARTFCQVAMLQAKVGGDLDAIYRCVKKYEGSMKSFYELAAPKVARKKAAADALKELYVYGVGGLRGMIPEVSERQGDYDRRQADRGQGIEDRIARLNLER